ncbi:MAG: hypothetical protein ACP5RD_00135 [bacterium]|jgi:hypothetical protein
MKTKLFFLTNFIFLLLILFSIYKEIEKTKMIKLKINNTKNEIENLKYDLNLILVEINLYKNPNYLKKILLKNYLMNTKEFILIIKMN